LFRRLFDYIKVLVRIILKRDMSGNDGDEKMSLGGVCGSQSTNYRQNLAFQYYLILSPRKREAKILE
jgi:hypothetical protein